MTLYAGVTAKRLLPADWYLTAFVSYASITEILRWRSFKMCSLCTVRAIHNPLNQPAKGRPNPLNLLNPHATGVSKTNPLNPGHREDHQNTTGNSGPSVA